MSLKLEIDSRPTQEDFEAKVQQCNTFRFELSNLAEQMSSNEKLIEKMQAELAEGRERQLAKTLLEERSVQTEALESTKEVPASTERVAEKQLISSSTEMPQTSITSSSTSTVTDNENEDDDALNNHPKVLYEDELIVFKEKCTNLTAENVRLQREVGELRSNMSQFHSSWLHNFMLKYLVPVLIVFVAYIFYLLK